MLMGWQLFLVERITTIYIGKYFFIASVPCASQTREKLWRYCVISTVRWAFFFLQTHSFCAGILSQCSFANFFASWRCVCTLRACLQPCWTRLDSATEQIYRRGVFYPRLHLLYSRRTLYTCSRVEVFNYRKVPKKTLWNTVNTAKLAHDNL